MALAKGSLDQWRCAHEKTFVSSMVHLQPGEENEYWTKPEGNTIKINVDAAIFDEQNMYGFGWAARNKEGRLVVAKLGSKLGSVNPELAEAMGVKEVLSWIKNNSYHDVIVVSDSLVTIQAIRSSVRMSSAFGFCVTECQELLSMLHNVRLCFVKRSANQVAHLLARAARLCADCSYTEASAPMALLDVILKDLN